MGLCPGGNNRLVNIPGAPLKFELSNQFQVRKSAQVAIAGTAKTDAEPGNSKQQWPAESNGTSLPGPFEGLLRSTVGSAGLRLPQTLGPGPRALKYGLLVPLTRFYPTLPPHGDQRGSAKTATSWPAAMEYNSTRHSDRLWILLQRSGFLISES